jgi:hypothetical protein
MYLIEYVRDEEGIPFGCVVAIDKDRIGWSICHTKDKFDKTRGKEIAFERARKNVLVERLNIKITYDEYIDYVIEKTRRPEKYKGHLVFKVIKKMRDRAIKYYKE